MTLAVSSAIYPSDSLDGKNKREHKKRTERYVQVNPYYRRGQAWEPFHDWPTSRMFDQDFGVGIDPEFELARQRLTRDPWISLSTQSSPAIVRTGHPLPRQSGGLSEVTTEDDKFKVTLDVKHFLPEELTVKTVGNYIEIRGKHEEKKDDHGVVSRDFTRKYTIPSNVDPLTVTSSLSPEGFLTVEAPVMRKAIEEPVKLQVKHEKQEAIEEKTEKS